MGATLEGGGTIHLPDGTQLTREQQFVRVIKKHGAVAHPSLTTIFLPNCLIEMTQKGLFLKAIELDPENATAYYNLSFALNPGETVILTDGQSMNSKSLILETILLNPLHAEAYSDFANNLPQNTPPIEFPDMAPMTKKDLYLKAIELDPQDGSAYYNLAHILDYDRFVTLPNGAQMNPKKLLLKAIDLNPYYFRYYSSLHNQLNVDETVKLLDGTTMKANEISDKIDDCANKYGLNASPY